MCNFTILIIGGLHAARKRSRSSASDARVTGRAFLKPGPKRVLRHALEVRHDSFITPAFIRLLRRHRAGLVVADTVDWPLLMDVTSDFVYCRLHGSEGLYASGYDDAALEVWADRVAAWATGCEHETVTRVGATAAPERARRDVYVYFDNDKEVRAPFDAHSLIDKINRRLGN